MKKMLVVLAVLLVVGARCSKPPSGSSSSAYAAAVADVEKHFAAMGTKIAANEIKKVDDDIDAIKPILKSLPDLATKEGKSVKEIDPKSKELTRMLSEMEEPAEGGKADEVKKLWDKFKGPMGDLISDLKKQ